MSKSLKSVIIVLSILIVDQVVKILIKTNMTLYEQIPILGNWAILHFVENKGMAFGLNLPGDYGKIILSIFRLLASGAIILYIRHLIKLNAHPGLIISLSMILAGAMGNIFDSAFFGLIFSESTPIAAATMFPEGGGYASFLHGNVVDMLYFPIIRGNYPDWLMGGKSFIFFRPVFNIADSSISIGVFIILLNQKRFFKHIAVEQNESHEDA